MVAAVVKYLRRKRYQYEVTSGLYMLTPMEKFIFNTIMFTFFSMIIIAASLYLPEHFRTIASRAYFYIAGDDSWARQSGGMFRKDHVWDDL